MHVTTGAAKSEPHGTSGRGARAGTGSSRRGGRPGGAGGVPGVRGARGVPGGAHYTSVDGCTYGCNVAVRLGQAGA